MVGPGRPRYVAVASWDDVRAAVEGREMLWYRAPLDVLPTAVLVKRAFKNGKVRVLPLADAPSFTADAAHLPRFCRMVR